MRSTWGLVVQWQLPRQTTQMRCPLHCVLPIRGAACQVVEPPFEKPLGITIERKIKKLAEYLDKNEFRAPKARSQRGPVRAGTRWPFQVLPAGRCVLQPACCTVACQCCAAGGA